MASTALFIACWVAAAASADCLLNSSIEVCCCFILAFQSATDWSHHFPKPLRKPRCSVGGPERAGDGGCGGSTKPEGPGAGGGAAAGLCWALAAAPAGAGPEGTVPAGAVPAGMGLAGMGLAGMGGVGPAGVATVGGVGT